MWFSREPMYSLIVPSLEINVSHIPDAPNMEADDLNQWIKWSYPYSFRMHDQFVLIYFKFGMFDNSQLSSCFRCDSLVSPFLTSCWNSLTC